MKQADLKLLFEKYLSEDLSEKEFKTLWDTLQEPEHKKLWMNLAGEVWENGEYHNLSDENVKQRILEGIHERIMQKPGRRILFIPQRIWWAAATVIVMLGLCTYFFIYQRSIQKPDITALKTVENDIRPGGNRAMLTLSNGKKVELDNVANGLLASQGSVEIIKKKSGELVYSGLHKDNTEVYYNTIETPRGGQYKISLPDGTQVWLNASSSIRYPVGFDSSERRVAITGEAYFEVAKDKRRPFRVMVDDMTVEVLGTHFNILGYPDEIKKTTLLEGSVQILKGDNKVLLNPGQQARVEEKGNVTIVKDADVEETIAWKNGLFLFRSANIETIMRQIARWYDVDITYKGKSMRSFSGEISRNANLSELLKILENTDMISFQVEGREISVVPEK